MVKKTREQHVAELAIHGRVELVGEFKGMTTKTEYRCLKHGEVLKGLPTRLRAGGGLNCCRLDKSRNQPHAKTAEQHKAELSLHGRVELIGKFIGLKHQTLYRCIEHGETHSASPRSVQKGCGLLCCQRASRERATLNKIASEKEHRKAIEKFGRCELVGKYVSSKTKTTYRCLEHGETYSAIPSNILKGRGLVCCKRESLKTPWNKTSLSHHLEELKDLGHAELVGELVDTRTPALYRCLIHGETHPAYPTNVRRGHGLACCGTQGTDSLDRALSGTHLFAKTELTSLYVYELVNHPGFLKPGIAKDCEQRADKEYGAQVCSWEREHRTPVFLVEQVLLKATRLMAHCPSDLDGWGGATEVRRMEADALVDMAQELVDELDACANPWEFAIAHGLLTPAQEKRAQVLIRAGAISEAELALAPCAA